MKLYQYAVLLHPTDEEKKTGKSTELIVPVTTVLAADDKQAAMLAARAIPEAYTTKLDKVDVAVCPF